MSPTVLADVFRFCETGLATSVTLQLDVNLALGGLNITSHAVDSPVRLVSCEWQYLLLSAPLCRVRELVSERARSEGEREREDRGNGGGRGSHALKGMGEAGRQMYNTKL